MLYPQNGDRIVTTHSVTSFHPVYTRQKQVCVQLPPSADNVTLRAFAAERRAALRRCFLEAAAAVDRYCLPAGPTAATSRTLLQTGQTDGQTDTVPLRGPCRILCTRNATKRRAAA